MAGIMELIIIPFGSNSNVAINVFIYIRSKHSFLILIELVASFLHLQVNENRRLLWSYCERKYKLYGSFFKTF